MTAQVFVSYRRADAQYAAGRLGDRLAPHFELFMDVDQIQAGARFPAVVRKALEETDVLLAVIGQQWLTLTAENGGRRIDQPDDWVAEEIGIALRRGTPIIPVLLDDARMPNRDDLPPALVDLADWQALRIAHESFGADSERLIKTIERVVSAVESDRRKQNLRDLGAAADHAAQAGHWGEAVDNLKAIDALQPSDEVKDRLAQALRRLRITELQNDVRAFAKTRNWKAVLAADAELALLDPQAGDLDGLATEAHAEMLEADLAASYAKGVKQLDEHDWTGAEETFGELLDRRASYQDAEALLALARRRRGVGAWRPSRSTAYFAVTAVLAILGIVLAFFGPESPVTEELTWDVDSHTTQAHADLPEGTAGLSPTLLGLDLPRNPIPLDVEANTFDIGPQRLFLAGAAIAEFDPSGEPVRLVRSGGSWWSPLLTIPGVVMVLGALFSFGYGASLLRPVRKRSGTVRSGELVGMAGVGAVLGGVITIAGWIAGNVPTAAGVLGVVLCLTAAAGLLPYAVAALPQRRDVILAAVPLAFLAVVSITWTAVGISGGERGSEPVPSPTQAPTKTTTPPAPVLKWQRGTDLPEPLEAAGVTVFGDTVWVVGGNAPTAGRPALDKVWFHKSGWQPGPKLPVRLHSMSVASDGERLFAVGGETTDSEGRSRKISRDVWVLDGPDDDSWEVLNRLPEERASGAVAWDGQRLVFAGGVNRRDLNGDGKAENVNHADLWVWEGEGKWRAIGQLQRPREDLVAASDGNGRVWFLGGADVSEKDSRMPLGAVDLVEKDRITQLSDIAPVRSSAAVWLADRGVCLFGGVARTPAGTKGTTKVVCVPETASPSPTVRPMPPLTLPRAGLGAAVRGKTIWVVGGFGPERKAGPTRPGLSVVESLALS